MLRSVLAAVIALVCLSISCEAQNANLEAFKGENILEIFRAAGAVHMDTETIGPFTHMAKDEFVDYASSGSPKAPRSPELLAIQESMPIHPAPSPEALLLGANTVGSASAYSISDILVTGYYSNSDSSCTTPLSNNLQTMGLCQYDFSTLAYDAWVVKSHSSISAGPPASVTINTYKYTDSSCSTLSNPTPTSVTLTLGQCTYTGSGYIRRNVVATVDWKAAESAVSNSVGKITYLTSAACYSKDNTKITCEQLVVPDTCFPEVNGDCSFSPFYQKITTCSSSGAVSISTFIDSACTSLSGTSRLLAGCATPGSAYKGYVSNTCPSTTPIPGPIPVPGPSPVPGPAPASTRSIINSLVTTYSSDSSCRTPVYNNVQPMGLCQYNSGAGAWVVTSSSSTPGSTGSVNISPTLYTDSSCTALLPTSSTYTKTLSIDSCESILSPPGSTKSTIVAAVGGTAAGPTVSNPIGKITYLTSGACQSQDATKTIAAEYFAAGFCFPGELNGSPAGTSFMGSCSASGAVSSNLYSDAKCQTLQKTYDLPLPCSGSPTKGFLSIICPAASATTSSKGSSSSAGAIAGGVVGAIAVVAIVVFYMKHQAKVTAIAAATAATTGVDKSPAGNPTSDPTVNSTANPMYA